MPCMTGLQRQKGDGPLVSSQEQKTLLVPVINRLSTAYQPLVNRSWCSSIGLITISIVRAFGKTSRKRFCISDAWGGTSLLGEMFCRRSVLPGATPPPRRIAVRLDPNCLWYVRVLESIGCFFIGLLSISWRRKVIEDSGFDAHESKRNVCFFLDSRHVGVYF